LCRTADCQSSRTDAERPQTFLFAFRKRQRRSEFAVRAARAGGPALPEFSAGSHLSLRVPNGMSANTRSATIRRERDRYVTRCCASRRAAARLGELRRSGQDGDEIMTAAPRNDFPLVAFPRLYVHRRRIGITPIMSMIRSSKRKAAASSSSTTARAARTPPRSARNFRAGIPRQVTIHHDGGNLDKRWISGRAGKSKGHLYCCGPRGLMDRCATWPATGTLRRCTSSVFSEGEAHKPADTAFQVVLKQSGTSWTSGDKTILESIRDAATMRRAPAESGTCGT